MTEEPIVTQLKAMITFLQKDLQSDQAALNNPRFSWYMKFKIKRQMSITRKQIQHFEDKIKKYQSDVHT